VGLVWSKYSWMDLVWRSQKRKGQVKHLVTATPHDGENVVGVGKYQHLHRMSAVTADPVLLQQIFLITLS